MAPAPAGGRRRKRLLPSTPQGIARPAAAGLRSTLRDGAEGAASLRGGRLIGSFREDPRSAARYTRTLNGAQISHNVMNTSVIVSPVTAYKPLSSEDLRRCAPSVFAEHARPGVSSRYTFVSTAQVVALLRDEG